MNWFIGSSPVVTTNNYYTMANLHNLQSLHTNLLIPLQLQLNCFVPLYSHSLGWILWSDTSYRLSLYRFRTDPTENAACIVEKACLPLCCTEINFLLSAMTCCGDIFTGPLLSNEIKTFVQLLHARIAGCLSSRCMAMFIYCCHGLKLEGVYRAAAQPCVYQICYSIITDLFRFVQPSYWWSIRNLSHYTVYKLGT
jgi:hypothetical protein